MDQKTLQAYSVKAEAYSKDWLIQPEPSDMYDLLKKFFRPEGRTADIGCGNGRDANWLTLNGFKVTGYDSSSELLNLASGLYPQTSFRLAQLPALSEIQDKYENVICETVIMHLPKSEIPQALENLKRILVKSGVLYLSWRVTENADSRHDDGRLYSAFEPSLIADHFPKSSILHFEDRLSKSSGKRVCRLVYRAD